MSTDRGRHRSGARHAPGASHAFRARYDAVPARHGVAAARRPIAPARSVLATGAALAVLGCTGLLLSACPGTLENKAAFGAGGGGCDDPPVDLIGPRCATANCHDATAKQQGLDLTPDSGLAARLVDVPSTLCMGTMLVNSGAPEQSAMYTKCLETNPCGLRMPASGAKLTDAEEQCLLEWITSL